MVLKKISNIFIIALILFMSLLSGCIHSQNSPYYKFHLEIEPFTMNDDYFILLPLPMLNNRSIFIDKINNMNIECHKEDTINGIAINITSSNFINIFFEGNPTDEMFSYQFSLLNGTIKYDDGKYWIYSNIKANIKYEYFIKDDNISRRFFIKSNLDIGWQLVDGEVWKHDID